MRKLYLDMSKLADDSDAPICYIDENRNYFMAAKNFKELMDKWAAWKTQL